MKRVISLLLALCFSLLPLLSVTAEESGAYELPEWVTFFLMCNEGMHNDGDNVGNTMMAVAMSPTYGRINLAIMTWDTFVRYSGYDMPQLLDQPFRVAGPEESMRVFNENFSMDIDRFLSVNYLALANMIDEFGGVTVPVSRAERNALNGMVASKANQVLKAYENNLMAGIGLEILTNEYYLEEYGPETHLNGLQAVGFGWLQYDSVYNCCEREISVISDFFGSVSEAINGKVVFYDNTFGAPEVQDGRRRINLDDPTEEDLALMRKYVDPIFAWSYNNLTEEEIASISIAIARTAFSASRYGVNLFRQVAIDILPLEVLNEYDVIAGKEGHLIDYDANAEALKEFLYRTDEVPEEEEADEELVTFDEW